ncbi:MAG: VPLPA-CTERM sorting domain-containing protein [Sedimenticolaceae bacterium]
MGLEFDSVVLAYELLTHSGSTVISASGSDILEAFGDPDRPFWNSSSIAYETSPVPIPAAVWLFASALGVFGYLGKRKANA